MPACSLNSNSCILCRRLGFCRRKQALPATRSWHIQHVPVQYSSEICTSPLSDGRKCYCAGNSGPIDATSQALAVRYVQKPQDGHADTVAKLSFSPSFVTYNPVTIQNIQDFFKTGEVGTAHIQGYKCLCLLGLLGSLHATT